MSGTRQEFIRRALNDTGFFCRHVLGFDYDTNYETEEVVNRGSGGVRRDGPHAEMTAFIDDPVPKKKLLMAPRGSYKSSIAFGYLMRMAIKNPNLRIAYGMETYQNALERLGKLKELFETSPMLLKTFGDMRSPHWRRNAFTLKGRSADHAAQTGPGFMAFGTDKVVTGFHFDIVFWDDPVSWQSIRTQAALEKTLGCYKMIQPLIDPGGWYLQVGTFYDEGDVHSYVKNELPDQFECLILDAGVDLVQERPGEFKLAGKPTFEHLTMDFLESQMRSMSPFEFSTQYLNRMLPSAMALFARHQFQPCRFEADMEGFNWFLLTDTATAINKEACYTSLGIVGLDAADNAYIADLEVGHFDPNTTVQKFMGLIEKWSPRITIKAQLMENTDANDVFRPMLREEARKRQVRLNLINLPRTGGEDGKDRRIQRLHGRFADRRLYVCNTVPRTFEDMGQVKVLFDPEGHHDDNGVAQPAGELVDELVRFPRWGKKDIADMLADIDGCDAKGVRYCHPPRQNRGPRRAQPNSRAGQVVVMDMLVGGRPQKVNVAQAGQYMGEDWWSQASKKIV